jgi:hypothetical protein
MALAARVLRVAAPGLSPPVSVRSSGDEPRIEAAPSGFGLATLTARLAQEELAAIGSGNVAVIHPASLQPALVAAFEAAGIDFGQAQRDGLDHSITLVPIGIVKGLEVDDAIVVEPAAIVGEEPQGVRALYVALTRATRRLSVLHHRALPEALAEPDEPVAAAG